METNEKIFQKVAEKLNPDFNINQFANKNLSLYNIIITAMRTSNNGLLKENKSLKKIIADDTDYKAMRSYAKELEFKLGIVTDSNK